MFIKTQFLLRKKTSLGLIVFIQAAADVIVQPADVSLAVWKAACSFNLPGGWFGVGRFEWVKGS